MYKLNILGHFCHFLSFFFIFVSLSLCWRGGDGTGGKGREGEGKLKCYRYQTYRPSYEAGPRGKFAPNKTMLSYTVVESLTIIGQRQFFLSCDWSKGQR